MALTRKQIEEFIVSKELYKSIKFMARSDTNMFNDNNKQIIQYYIDKFRGPEQKCRNRIEEVENIY